MKADRKDILTEARVAVREALMAIEQKHGLCLIDGILILKTVQDELMAEYEKIPVRRLGTAAALIKNEVCNDHPEGAQ